MNRIDLKLQALKEQNKKALITFITSGDGGYETTENAVYEMERAGADIEG
jgi:tryptophan synthase alpha chain